MGLRRIVFRTDASLDIGTGHVVRDLTLAQALRDRGATVTFVCRTYRGHLADLIEEHDFDVRRLPSADAGGTSWARDVEETRTALEDATTGTDWLVVDHYGFDRAWEGRARAFAHRIMVIDDLADREHDCDLLLDQNLTAREDTRYAGKLPASCVALLGPRYALLQPEYAELHDRTPPRQGPIRRILLFMSGGDPENLTGRMLATVVSLERPEIEVDVVIGTGNPHAATVGQVADRYANVRLHRGLPTLAPLMARADLAIGASGMTTWERLCLGLPALVVTMTEEQRPFAADLHERGLVRWLGHQNAVTESAIARVLSELLREGLDVRWSTRCREVVDGGGVQRVCAALG